MKRVSRQLFNDSRLSVYAVLDGASVPGLPARLSRHEPAHECLYRGELAPDIAEVAPYLVQLEAGTEFAEWVTGEGWGRHWGIFALSAADLRQMRRHFRTFLIVHDEAGRPLYFRFYDPRVLRVYLPTCAPSEVAKIFGPVSEYVLEGSAPDKIVHFAARADGTLRQEETLLAADPADGGASDARGARSL